jgi:hypothetical protein
MQDANYQLNKTTFWRMLLSANISFITAKEIKRLVNKTLIPKLTYRQTLPPLNDRQTALCAACVI